MNRVLLSLQHPMVKHLVKLRREASYRYEHGSLLLEGIKPIREIAPFIRKIFYTAAEVDRITFFEGEKWEISEPILHKISGMPSPEGIIAEVELPSFTSLNKFERVLALDGISDPGNMGTLLRTALALGWDAIFFLPGCSDPFNEKTLRAARGAHFKLALSKGSPQELKQWVDAHQVQPLVAEIKGSHPEELIQASHRLLVLGNEAHGPSQSVRQFCQSVTIPMSSQMESLNVAVAGGILLYLLSKVNYEI